jgi:arginyl-tRNA synthetase
MTTSDPIGLRGELGALFQAAIQKAYPGVVDPVVLMPCGQARFGDYQCNNAMGLFGKLKGKEGAPKAPRDAANGILAALPANELVAETSLAGPGAATRQRSRCGN